MRRIEKLVTLRYEVIQMPQRDKKHSLYGIKTKVKVHKMLKISKVTGQEELKQIRELFVEYRN